jgi:hypothetical protein
VSGGIIHVLEDVGEAFSKLLDSSVDAGERLLQMFVWGIIISALAGVAFTVVKSSVEGNSAAEGAVDAGQAVYDFGSLVQDLIEYGKIAGIVVGAILGVYYAIMKLADKIQNG